MNKRTDSDKLAEFFNYVGGYGWTRWPAEAWYWLKCYFFKRYDRIVCPSLYVTYTDQTNRLLHAAFTCLVEFVERERPLEYVIYEDGVAEEMMHLYEWWLGARNDIDLDDQPPYTYEKCNEMLHRLIDIRGHLWT